jgi:hypothetical protein
MSAPGQKRSLPPSSGAARQFSSQRFARVIRDLLERRGSYQLPIEHNALLKRGNFKDISAFTKTSLLNSLQNYCSDLACFTCGATESALIFYGANGASKGVPEMCDFSLQSVRSRPAKVGDKLVTRDFGTGTRGFAAAGDLELAVCVMPGTELAFTGEVACLPTGLLGWRTKIINHQTAIFRQVNKDKLAAHHDALEFPDGRIVLLTLLCEGQAATVLQLPAQPSTAAEANAQKRVTYVG